MSRLVSALALALLLTGAILCAVPAKLNAACCSGNGQVCCGTACSANEYGCEARCPCRV